MNSSQQIKYGAVISYLALGINIIAGLVYTPWMISSIGQSNFGLYTLAMSVISLFVFDFGLSNAVTRFLSKFLAEGKQEKAHQFLGLVYKLYLLIDVIIFLGLIVVYFFIPYIYKELTPIELDKFKVIYVIASVFCIFSFPFIPLDGILKSTEHFIQLKSCDLIHKLLIVTAMTICLLLGYGLYALVLVNAISGLFIILLKVWLIKKYTSLTILWGYKDFQLLKEVLSFSGWTMVISLCLRSSMTLAPTILGFFCGSVSVAIFGIAHTIEGYVFTFSNALGGMFLPRVSQIISNKDGDVLPLMIKVGRVQLIVVGAIILGFICLGRDFIQLWVGNGFRESYICALLIILPSFFLLPQEIGLQTIYARNKVKQEGILFLIILFLNLFFGFLFTWMWGILGLCISISFSCMVRVVGQIFIFKRYLNIQVGVFSREVYFRIGLVVIFATVLNVLVFSFYSAYGWIHLLFKGIIFLSIYSLCIYYVLNQDEKVLLTGILRKLRGK